MQRLRFPAFSCFSMGLWVTWFLMLCPANQYGQSTRDVDPVDAAARTHLAPVEVDGEILFYVIGVSSYPAEDRAKTISNRINKVAANYLIAPDAVRAIPDERKIQIMAGTDFIMNVYDLDGESEGVAKETLAELYAGKIKSSLVQYRAERRPESIQKKYVNAIISLAVLVVVMLLTLWILRRMGNWFKRRMRTKIDTLENVSFKLIQSENLLKALHVFYQIVRLITITFIIAFFAQYILSLFPWSRGPAKIVLHLVVNPLKSIASGFIEYLPSLIFLVIIFFITRYVLRLIRLFFDGLGSGAIEINNFDPEWAIPTYKIVRIVIVAFALVLAFPYIPGSETSAFKGVSVFLGVLLSLGSSSFIANMIAGYSMTYRRAFKIGDRIEINDMGGYVKEQSLMVTRLRSYKNEEIVIPNSIMLNSSLINYSAKAKEKGLILHTTVGIGYETPWRQVDAMLKLAADRTEGLLKDPPPFVLKRALGDFAITYEINAYSNDASKVLYNYNELHQHILDIFNENNVQIMTPAYEGDPEIPKVVPKDQWNTPLASEK